MNLNNLYYLLRKVRYFGTEESTFFELGFKKEQAYYDTFGKFMFGYVSVGTSNTMFTCHLDTVENKRIGTNKAIYLDSKKNHIFANNQVLGADDGAGVALLCHMIENEVAGHYFFFAGEELGGTGSNYLARNFSKLFPSLKLDKAIAFDRKGTNDVVISQFWGQCCSESFALALCKELGTEYEPAHGSFTDTANFVDFIPECTNISIGYYNEHSKDEYLDLGYLQRLAKKVLGINWESLPTKRICEPEFIFEDHWLTEEEEDWYELEGKSAFLFNFTTRVMKWVEELGMYLQLVSGELRLNFLVTPSIVGMLMPM